MLNRRTLLLGAALTPLVASRRTSAQAGYPNQVIKIVVPFAPGSFTDVSARLIAQELTEQLGHVSSFEAADGPTLRARWWQMVVCADRPALTDPEPRSADGGPSPR